jgi:hypothetical protein
MPLERTTEMSQAKSKMFLWIVLLILLFLTAMVANSTTLVPMSFDELTQRATTIVRVRCVSVHSAWSGGEIWTASRFEIREEAKPDAFGPDQYILLAADRGKTGAQNQRAEDPASRGSIVVRQLGGSTGGLRSRVEGIPEFTPGEEDYLFLWRRAGEPYRVLGWAQGTFRIARNPRTGDARVTQDSAVTTFHGESRAFQSSGVRNMSLAAFQQKLHQSISSTSR